MKNVSTLFIALSLTALAGCPGDDGGTGDTDATTAPTTTMMPTGDDGTPTAGDDDGMATTAGDDDGMDDDGMATTAGDTAGMDETAGMDTTGGGGAGFCAQSCKDVADCVPPGGMERDYACTDGFCEFTGTPIDPCDPAVCIEAAGLVCGTVDGTDVCATACPNGDECDLIMQECVMDDNGDPICQSPPCFGAGEGEPCDIPGFGQVGTCTDGTCSCTDNSECTGPGLACQSG